MPSSALAKPAKSSASPFGTISVPASQSTMLHKSNACQTSSTAALLPDRHHFCPCYRIERVYHRRRAPNRYPAPRQAEKSLHFNILQRDRACSKRGEWMIIGLASRFVSSVSPEWRSCYSLRQTIAGAFVVSWPSRRYISCRYMKVLLPSCAFEAQDMSARPGGRGSVCWTGN